MLAGRLRHRLEIQSATEARDAHGGIVRTWVTDRKVWGSVEPLRGREFYEAQQVDGRLTHKVVLRYAGTLTPSQRIKHRSRFLNIFSVRNLDERDRTYEVLAEEDL